MNDIWTTEDYTNKGKANKIAKKYGLNIPMVYEALDDLAKIIEDLMDGAINYPEDCIVFNGVKYRAKMNITFEEL